MKEIARIKEQLINEPWLITQEAFVTLEHSLAEVFTLDMEGVDILDQNVAMDSGIAVVNIEGTMMRNVPPLVAQLFGLVDTAVLQEKIKELTENDSVEGIMLDIDSPGGSATGIGELADLISKADEVKPVYASTEGLMASAAYWVGSQARAVLSTASAKVGSIGVYLPVIDAEEAYKSKGIKVKLITNKEATYKGAGFEGTKMTEEQEKYMQDMVQDIFNDFRDGVVSSRPQVESDAMRGQVFLGNRAKSQGLIDMVGSYDDAMFLLKKEVDGY